MRALVLPVVLFCLACSSLAQEKQLLWGDTHLHSSYSVDAFAVGNLTADPDTAYGYARGLPVIHPYHRARVQIDTPLDFLAVADHAEFLGVISHVYEHGIPPENLNLLQRIHGQIATWVLRWSVESDFGLYLFGAQLPVAENPPQAALSTGGQAGTEITGIPPLPEVESAAWREITQAADRHNRPGEFTALIGWEWSPLPGGAKLHRVVLTDSDAETAQRYQPFSSIDSPFPEDLWAWLETTSVRTGADFVAIPHNSNLSKGYMFDTASLRGQPFSPEYIARRMRWERVVEITQIKGDSETHPALSPEDTFADFETYPFYVQRKPTPYVVSEGDYVRSALKRGLALEGDLGQNPFQFGLIGSTDSHTGLASAEEDNFHGKLARDSIPENKSEGALAGGVIGWNMSASGLAAVWAEENTRASILAALKRREVYATSGPRIGVQFFAGTEITDELLESGEVYERARESGVPMGGELKIIDGKSPAFLVQAFKDPVGANLDRVQIVKGWMDGEGRLHERVFNVVWSGDRIAGSDGGIEPIGDSVDRTTGHYRNDIGEPALATVWKDPDFDPSQAAFYYARVLQIPTPRHSLLDALALGLDTAEGFPDVIQERAYTSPIWYKPFKK